ncbi:MAG: hypothetical protein LUD72_04395 [Bacteroidales bacterium]|nr:hypothetical protein [Bacteroidales bacterium]
MITQDIFRERVLRVANNGCWHGEMRTDGGSYHKNGRGVDRCRRGGKTGASACGPVDGRIPPPLGAGVRQLHNLTDECIDRIRHIGERGFIVIDACRDNVCVRNNPYLDLEYECRQENGMPGILTDEMKAEWLIKRNNYVESTLRAEFLLNQHCYTPVYCLAKTNDDSTRITAQYVAYTDVPNKRDVYCTWEELLGFGFAMCRKYKLETLFAQQPEQGCVLYDLRAKPIKAYTPKYDYAFVKSGPEGMGDRISYIQRGEVSVF